MVKKMWILCFCIGFSSSLFSKDFGIVGHTYPITEMDLLVWLNIKMQRWLAIHSLEDYQKAWEKRARKSVLTPPRVKNITVTKKQKTWQFDPSIQINRNIFSANGKRLISRGQRVNPLDYTRLHSQLIFFNANKSKQRCWVKNRMTEVSKTPTIKLKLILVAGNIESATKQLKQRVYFDQQGKLVQRFGIQHVPALVKQVGNHLQITEEKPC